MIDSKKSINSSQSSKKEPYSSRSTSKKAFREDEINLINYKLEEPNNKKLNNKYENNKMNENQDL